MTGVQTCALPIFNVFPTFEQYIKQFELFIETIEPKGHLVYCSSDSLLVDIVKKTNVAINKIAYNSHPSEFSDDKTYLVSDSVNVEIGIFGKHNMQNISATKEVCKVLGISDNDFYKAISTFNGAAKRLQRIGCGHTTEVFLDFAHAPSKVRATVNALKEHFPYRKLVACLELHTFSSLNPNFLPEYKGTLCTADEPIVFFNPKTLEHKKLPPIDPGFVKQKFDNPNLKVFTNSKELLYFLEQHFWDNTNLLLMSSGNFSGLDLMKLASTITEDDDFPRKYLQF